MKKALMLASVASMIDQFNMNNINILKNMGYQVHVIANFKYGSTTSKERTRYIKQKLESIGVKVYDIEIDRNVFSYKNIKIYRKIKKIINQEKYDLIHCHSPIGGVITRLASMKSRKEGTKVIYTAHGFHFFKGAPIRNWIMFYPVELLLSKFTDLLITINKQDYMLAKKTFKADKIRYIHGVGVNTDLINNVKIDKIQKRKELGIPIDAFVVVSVGELNNNKNHRTIVKAIKELNDINVYYLICGHGELRNELIKYSEELQISNQVKLLGYRDDVSEIYKASDICAFPSKREGLGMAALEAMACGLPIITSNVHGIVDYSINGITGYRCKPIDHMSFSAFISKLKNDAKLRSEMSQNNINSVKKFSIDNVNLEMKSIYSEI